MPKQLNYTLTEEELSQIREAMKSSNARVAKRANIVHNLHLGYTPQEVAQQHNISVGTVYNQFNRFKAEGVGGLHNKPKSGRRPKANQAFRRRLTQVIETDPSEFGYGFSVWTLPSLQAFMEQDIGVKLSQNRLSEVLQEEGYVYRRPKKDLSHMQDPDHREQVQKTLDELKKASKMGQLGYSLWTKADSV